MSEELERYRTDHPAMTMPAGNYMDVGVVGVIGGFCKDPDVWSQEDSVWFWNHSKAGILIGRSYPIATKPGWFDRRWDEFKPSTSDADAVFVFDRLSAGKVTQLQHFNVAGHGWQWVATIDGKWAYADTIALAICRAVLRTAMETH